MRWSVTGWPTAIAVLVLAGLTLSPTAWGTESQISGILAGTWQHADGSHASSTSRYGEANGQLDVFLTLPMGPGSWQMEVKAGTTPRSDGISAMFPEANGLSGETLNAAGQGRGAITQFYYEANSGIGTISTGLLFAHNFLDTNPVADDEYRGFLATPFINNPTIALPIYVMGAAMQGAPAGSLGYTVFVSSTADLHENTYPNLFDFGGHGHGAFMAIEMNWRHGGLSGNVGAWRNNDDSYVNFSDGQPQADFGLYTNLNGRFGEGLHWNVRAGWADPRVSEANGYLGAELACDSHFRAGDVVHPVTYGLGFGNTWASPDMTGPSASRQHAEMYARAGITDGFTVTFDLQYLRHSGFRPDIASTWVEGIRMAVEF